MLAFDFIEESKVRCTNSSRKYNLDYQRYIIYAFREKAVDGKTNIAELIAASRRRAKAWEAERARMEGLLHKRRM